MHFVAEKMFQFCSSGVLHYKDAISGHHNIFFFFPEVPDFSEKLKDD